MSKGKKKDDGRVFCDDGSVLIKDNSEASKKIDELLKDAEAQMEDKGGEMNKIKAKQNQYEIRELVIINFIEWYASEEEDREPLRQSMQLYLQQELWVDFEGMELKDMREEEE